MIQSACQSVPTIDRFAPGIMGYLDCQAQTLGTQGYQALAMPGSTVSILLTGLLTLFVAFIGYRLLFGQMLTVREGVLACVKIGAVLALSTNWPAYQRVIYDVVLHEPADLVAEVGAPAGITGAGGGLVDHLDYADGAFAALAVQGPGQLSNERDPRQVAPPLFRGFDTFALGASRVVFLTGALGAFALLRIVAGLLLAVGPLFIAFLLFEGTRGLFDGWLRGLIAAALGALATAIVLGMELALIEPWLGDLLNRRAASLAIAGVPAELFATSIIFTAVLGAVLIVMSRIAFSWKFPVRWSVVSNGTGRTGVNASSAVQQNRAGVPLEHRSRAAVVAEAVSASERREAGPRAAGGDAGPRRVPANAARSRDTETGSASSVPLGHSFSRRVGTRVSASAATRDRRS